MLTNDLKSGAKVLLRNGWFATILDNRKGNIRFAEVYGVVKEKGSIYSHNIVSALIDGKWVQITHTKAQLKAKAVNESFFGDS